MQLINNVMDILATFGSWAEFPASARSFYLNSLSPGPVTSSVHGKKSQLFRKGWITEAGGSKSQVKHFAHGF